MERGRGHDDRSRGPLRRNPLIHAARLQPLPALDGAARRAGLVLAIALHVGAAVAVLSFEPSRRVLLAAVPIMVELITPPQVIARPEPPKPRPAAKPRPRPEPRPVVRPPDPVPVAVAPAPAPTPVEVAPPPPSPPPAPAPVAVAPPPVIETPPIFAADYLDNPKPTYPMYSRRMGEQGRVLLRVHVTAGGAVDEVRVSGSSGFSRLDQAAADTVRRWRFVPAKRGTQPVPAWVQIPVSFQLEG